MINSIVEKGLCIGCGACEAVCPVSAISVEFGLKQYVAEVNREACVRCGACIRVCPNNKPFEEIPATEKWLSYAADDKIREVASSGGVTRILLDVALKTGLAHRAIVTEMNGVSAETKSVRSIDLYSESMNSCYCPVNPLSNVKTESDERIIFVGLPCHIVAFRRLQERCVISKESIAVGLFCNHCPTKFMAKSVSSDFCDNPKSIRFRGEGWPGTTKISCGNEEHRLPWKKVWADFGKNMEFSCLPCRTCGMVFSEQADISVGDAWIPGRENVDSLGSNIILVRTNTGKELFRSASRKLTSKRITDEQFESAFGKLRDVKKERSE